MCQYRTKKASPPKCPISGQRLPGIKALRPCQYSNKRMSKRQKTVNRAYGGCLAHNVVRERIVRAFLLEERKIVKKACSMLLMASASCKCSMCVRTQWPTRTQFHSPMCSCCILSFVYTFTVAQRATICSSSVTSAVGLPRMPNTIKCPADAHPCWRIDASVYTRTHGCLQQTSCRVTVISATKVLE